MFWPHKAIIRQLLIDRDHYTAWVTHQYIYMLLLDVVIFENVRSHFPCAIFVLRHSRCVSFVRGFPMSGMCPLYKKLCLHYRWK
jgi:hypothetical protein